VETDHWFVVVPAHACENLQAIQEKHMPTIERISLKTESALEQIDADTAIFIVKNYNRLKEGIANSDASGTESDLSKKVGL
jgi:hypothetical protein